MASKDALDRFKRKDFCMAVRIRLSRVGKKKTPFYRIVAVDGRKKRDGAFLENLGSYNGLTGKFIQFHKDRIDYWIGQGAIPSDAVKKLQKEYETSGAQAA